jgi:hypothetical protein
MIFLKSDISMHTTNYYNTFITIAEDCRAAGSEIPPVKNEKLTVANIQFDLISNNPYKFSSDDVIFKTYCIKNNIPECDYVSERKIFFSKGQPCFRSSPLTKRYGWGLHSNNQGKIALIVQNSDEYNQFSNDSGIKLLKAMRSKRV